jgi:hypothetical protein
VGGKRQLATGINENKKPNLKKNVSRQLKESITEPNKP